MRSRVKSDEEYNQILNSEQQAPSFRHEKKVSDALAFFNQNKEQEATAKNADPFKNMPSINDIKAQLREKERLSVQQLKDEIAAAQTNKEKTSTGFNYDDNANKLYGTLRDNRLNQHLQRQTQHRQTTEQPVIQNNATYDNKSFGAADLHSAYEQNNVVLTNPMREQLAAQETVANVNADQGSFPGYEGLDLGLNDAYAAQPLNLEPTQQVVTADDFPELEQASAQLFNDLNLQLDAVDDAAVDPGKSLFPSDENTISTTQPIKLDDLAAPIASDINKADDDPVANEAPFAFDNDILSNLKPDPPAKKEDDFSQQGLLPQDIINLGKANEKQVDLSNTLSIALDQNTKDNVTKSDLELLKNEELTVDKEKPKTKVGDILVTSFIIIMIIVVLFLILKIVFDI